MAANGQKQSADYVPQVVSEINLAITMTTNDILYQEQLVLLVKSSSKLMDALMAVRSLGLSSWCIGAGVVRSLVWDHLHGYEISSAVEDLDVAYFDASAPLTRDLHLQQRLTSIAADVNWEVVNQAKVHEWYGRVFGQEVPALMSLEDGLSTWPEYATCVGIQLCADDSLRVIAPYGLADLFEMRIRHNPRRVSFETFSQRIHAKRVADKWPKVSICGE